MNKIDFNEKLKNEIKEYYKQQNIGLEYISKKIGISRHTIKRMLIREGVTIKSTSLICRKYNVNENFLDTIDKQQAYFLGWIASDGSVALNNEITLHLQDRDLDVITKIKSLLNWEGPIRFINTESRRIKYGYKTTRNAYGISIANQRLANQLRNLGYNNDKSYSLDFPNFLNINLLSHFLRSFIEGDGSIVYCDNNLYVSFVSTNIFCLKFKDFVESNFNIKVFVEGLRNTDNKTHSRSLINGNYNSLKFLNYMYNDAFLYMDRKFNYFKNVVEILSRNPKCHNKTKEQLAISRNIIESIKKQSPKSPDSGEIIT